MQYYCAEDMGLFDTMHISPEAVAAPRRPQIASLHDVFITIAQDEIEHQKTMGACQDPVKVGRSASHALSDKQRATAVRHQR